MQKNAPAEIVAWFTLFILSLIWGSSFILIKKALIAFEPAVVGTLRLVISGMVFIPVLVVTRKNIDWKKWPIFAAVGLTGTGIPAYMYAIAQTEISSSVSGLLNSMTPIFTLLLGLIFFNGLFSKFKLAGVLLGFSGAASLLLLSKESAIGGKPLYGLLVVVGTMCYGTSVNMVKRYFQDVNPIQISAVSFGFVAIPATFFLFFSSFFTQLKTESHALFSLGAVALLSIMGTVAASIIFFKLVQNTNAVFASTVAYLMPVVALGWGMVDGEIISIFHLFSLILILTGVYLIKKE